MTSGSVQFELLVRLYNCFRNVHAKSVMIVQTSGSGCAKGRSSRENTWSVVWRVHVRKTIARAWFWAQNALNSNSGWGNIINIEKRSVWANGMTAGPETKTAGSAREHRTQGQRWRIVCKPNSLKLSPCIYNYKISVYTYWVYKYIHNDKLVSHWYSLVCNGNKFVCSLYKVLCSMSISCICYLYKRFNIFVISDFQNITPTRTSVTSFPLWVV